MRLRGPWSSKQRDAERGAERDAEGGRIGMRREGGEGWWGFVAGAGRRLRRRVRMVRERQRHTSMGRPLPPVRLFLRFSFLTTPGTIMSYLEIFPIYCLRPAVCPTGHANPGFLSGLAPLSHLSLILPHLHLYDDWRMLVLVRLTIGAWTIN
jgi:hypothetical protein